MPLILGTNGEAWLENITGSWSVVIASFQDRTSDSWQSVDGKDWAPSSITTQRLKKMRVENNHFETRHSKPLQDNNLDLGGVRLKRSSRTNIYIQLLRCIVRIKTKKNENSVMLNICLNNYFYQWLSHTWEHTRVAYGSWLAARLVHVTGVR